MGENEQRSECSYISVSSMYVLKMFYLQKLWKDIKHNYAVEVEEDDAGD